MKYISMKMEPKGNRPPMSAIMMGRKYHCRSGIGDGILFTRHGLSGNPFQLRPTTCEMARTLARCSLAGQVFHCATGSGNTLACVISGFGWDKAARHMVQYAPHNNAAVSSKGHQH